MLTEFIGSGLEDQADMFWRNADGLYYLGSSWGVLTDLNYASGRNATTELASSGCYEANEPADAVWWEFRARASTLADSIVYAHDHLAVKTLPNATETEILGIVSTLDLDVDEDSIATAVQTKLRGGGTVIFRPVIKKPGGTPIADAYVGIYLNGEEKAYQFSNAAGRCVWGGVEGFLIEPNVTYGVRVKADNHDNLPEQALNVSTTAERIYTLTPRVAPTFDDPFVVPVLITAGQGGEPVPGVKFTIYRQSDGPLVIGGNQVPLKSATETTDDDGAAFIPWYPSDTEGESGTSWDGRVWVECPTYGLVGSRRRAATIPSTPDEDGFYRLTYV